MVQKIKRAFRFRKVQKPATASERVSLKDARRAAAEISKSKRSKKKKENCLKFIFSGDAAVAIRKLAKITQRDTEEVVSDAFRAHMWILFEQAFGGVVNARHNDLSEARDLESLVKDEEAAKKYLAHFRHLFRRHAAIVSLQQD